MDPIVELIVKANAHKSPEEAIAFMNEFVGLGLVGVRVRIVPGHRLQFVDMKSPAIVEAKEPTVLAVPKKTIEVISEKKKIVHQLAPLPKKKHSITTAEITTELNGKEWGCADEEEDDEPIVLTPPVKDGWEKPTRRQRKKWGRKEEKEDASLSDID